MVQKVRLLDALNEENDPHGEHDFGSFVVRGQKVYYHIDYFDRSLEFGSEDPADPEKKVRVLTLMLAHEY